MFLLQSASSLRETSRWKLVVGSERCRPLQSGPLTRRTRSRWWPLSFPSLFSLLASFTTFSWACLSRSALHSRAADSWMGSNQHRASRSERRTSTARWWDYLEQLILWENQWEHVCGRDLGAHSSICWMTFLLRHFLRRKKSLVGVRGWGLRWEVPGKNRPKGFSI